jgi:tRNA G26 N,N-dimethylase Trm1
MVKRVKYMVKCPKCGFKFIVNISKLETYTWCKRCYENFKIYGPRTNRIEYIIP